MEELHSCLVNLRLEARVLLQLQNNNIRHRLKQQQGPRHKRTQKLQKQTRHELVLPVRVLLPQLLQVVHGDDLVNHANSNNNRM